VSFLSLGLQAELLRAVSDVGYDQPTPVQTRTIPLILEGRDILAGAQTGTGKTAGFALPLLQLLSASATKENGRPARPGTHPSRPVRALILTPTRELAAQVELSVKTYGQHLPLRSAAIFGGVGIVPQKALLRKGVDIVVATPGRLMDHLSQRTVDLSRVEILVLDEADRMLDMGFIRDIRKILAMLPRNRQNLLFSATFSDEIKELADGFLNSPEVIQVAERYTAPELVSQVTHPVDRGRKRDLLSHLIGEGNWKQVLVFTRTKHGANRLTHQLVSDGIAAIAIHGNKSQAARTKALGDFKKGTVRVLVATDIAARGLDIDQLPHVVNYELPHVPEDYLHRIGRTGRAGNEGTAVSLVCVDEHQLLRDIERLLKRSLPSQVIRGFEPDPSARPEPIVRGGASGGGKARGPRPGGNPRSGSRPKAGSNAESGRRPATGARPKEERRPGANAPSERGKRPALHARSGSGQRAFAPGRPARIVGDRRTEERSAAVSAAPADLGRTPRKTRSSSRPRRPGLSRKS
jgi:ATP-dependent RNA helicase RhlE